MALQCGYFNSGERAGTGLNLQNKMTSLMSIHWPAPLRLMRLCTMVCISEKLCVVVTSLKLETRGIAHHRMKLLPVDSVQEVAPIWTTSHGMLGRWHPSRDMCGKCQRSKIDWEETWDSSDKVEMLYIIVNILGNTLLICFLAESQVGRLILQPSLTAVHEIVTMISPIIRTFSVTFKLMYFKWVRRQNVNTWLTLRNSRS